MEIKTLRTALAVGVLALASAYATQASAAPSFTFTEYGGFDDNVAVADYSDPLAFDANLTPAVTPVYGTMSWVTGQNEQSSLVLTTETGPAPLPVGIWTRISTLTHNNNIIPNATNWANQDIWGRFIVQDAFVERLDSDDAITLAFTETSNVLPVANCPAPNPNGSSCDDFFAFTASGLNSLAFFANDGSDWLAQFRFGNLINAQQVGDTIYTAEGGSSSLEVQVLITEIPEPATLSLLGLGLLGLGFAKRRQLKG